VSAIISDCGLYRYRLERQGGGPGRTAVIMVNPSTADAEQDDPTIRKLKGFGERNDWGTIIVGNLFAYRATDVRKLSTCLDPTGPLNDEHLLAMIHQADRVIVAWGPSSKLPKPLRNRFRTIVDMAGFAMRPLYSIGAPAQDGHPKHPLMLAYAEPITPWSFAA
jgi:hypothetical protein